MGAVQMLIVRQGRNEPISWRCLREFLRNSNLDARNYFDLPPATIGHRLPEFRRNNFGGAFGGPIKKDRTFFFGVYEGLSQSLGTTNTASVLGPGCHGAAGAVITLAACSQISPQTSVTIAPQIAPWLALYPLPNLPGNTLWLFGFTQPTSEHYGQMRVDQTISSNDTFFTRYTVDQSAQTSVLNLPAFSQSFTSRGQFLTLSENHIFSTSLLNTARFSFSRTNLIQPIPTGPSCSSCIFVPGQSMGGITVAGLTAIGTGGTPPNQYLQNVFTWSDDLDLYQGASFAEVWRYSESLSIFYRSSREHLQG